MISLDFTDLATDFDGCVNLGCCFCLWFRLVLLRGLAPGVSREQERRDDASGENDLDAKDRLESVWLDSHLFLLTRKGSTPRVIRAMDLGMAIGTAAIYGPNVQRLSGGGRMARQHMNMALLAQQTNASSQKLVIVRTMRRVTVHAVFADRRMFPEKRAPFFSMAGVTHIIDGVIHEHLPAFPAMRIVAGSATDLHVTKLGAEQMGGPLEQSFPLFRVAAETGFFYRKGGQHLLRELNLHRIECRPIHYGSIARGQCPLGEFGMVHVVAGHAAHVASVVLAALPVKMATIARVTLKARCVCSSSLLRGFQFGWIIYVRGGDALFSVLNVPFTIAMASLALSRARVAQEFRSFAVNFETVGIHIGPVARNTLIADRGSSNSRLGGLRLETRPGNRLRPDWRRIRKGRKNSDEGYNTQ